MGKFSRQLIGVCAVVVAATVRPAPAQVDMEAVRAYLRTDINAGSEVTTPALGQLVFVHIDYRVVGGTGRFLANVRALIDGVEQCGGAIDFDPNVDEVIWCPRGFMATAGTHTVRWELDSTNMVNESNENNNTVELTFTTAGAGSLDMEALRAYLLPQVNDGAEIEVPCVGQQIFFHVDYRVGGTGPAFMARINATIDDLPHCGGPVEFDTNMDGLIWCPGGWTATEGIHTVRWELDDDNMISETDENNNVAELTFSVDPTCADIEAERAYLRTEPNAGDEVAQPAIGQDVFFHVDFRVVGGGAPFEADIRALIDDEEHCGGTIEFNPDEASTVWCPAAWTATAGSHSLRWELDINNQLEETDEANNAAVATFTVGGPAPCIGDCDRNDNVVVNEVVIGVNIALERAEVEMCTPFDRDGDGRVVVSELVTGVDNLLRGCR
jgi:hypothetical protein